MGQEAIYSATLGLSPPWKVTSVAFAKESNRLDIDVAFEGRILPSCPVCGAPRTITEAKNEIWLHDDYLNYATYLHARVPHLLCGCGILPLERPWCRAGSRFARIV